MFDLQEKFSHSLHLLHTYKHVGRNLGCIHFFGGFVGVTDIFIIL